MSISLFDAEFMKQLRKLRLRLDSPCAAAVTGLRKSNARGSSIDFSDYREYVPGDDTRKLDWNAYARFHKLYMKLYMEEQEGRFHIMIDLTPSMNFGEVPKKYHALRLGAALAYMVLSSQDRVYLSVMGSREVLSLSGLASFPKVLAFLERRYQEENGTEQDENKNVLREKPVLFDWRTQIGQINYGGRGKTILVSDFMDGTAQLEEIIKYLRLSAKQEVLMVHVLAEEELNPVLKGSLELSDLESGDQVRVTVTPALLKAYHKNLECYLTDIKKIAAKSQCGYLRSTAGEPLADFLQNGMHRGWEGKGR